MVRQGVTTLVLGESGSDGEAVNTEGVLGPLCAGAGASHARTGGPQDDGPERQKSGFSAKRTNRERLLGRSNTLDPKTVIDRATFEQPNQYPEGIEYILVNGRVALERGRHTGERPGKVLRCPGFKKGSPLGSAGRDVEIRKIKVVID